MEINKSKALFQMATQRIPGGVNSPVRAFKQVGGTPIYFDNAGGSRVRDSDGNEYIDFCQSWGPLILGHARKEVVEAVREAAFQGLSFGACHEKEIRLADLILDAFPEFHQVRTVNSGTEAVMTALRIARGYTGRNLVLKFEGGYHGHFDGMLVKAGSGLVTQAIASSSGVPKEIAGTTLVAPLDDTEAVRNLFDKYGDDIAAVIVEPMPANNGLLIQRREYLEFLREITKKQGSLLIFDEVISGFRVRFGGYGELMGITPDLITLGKIIGGGMPVGAVLGNKQIMKVLAPEGTVYQAGTLSGNPVSLAAGIATLTILQEEHPYDRLAKLGYLFTETLKKKGPAYARAVRSGSIVWIYLDKGEFPRAADTISKKAMDRFTAMYWKLLEKGYYLPPSSYEVLFISAAHTEDEVIGLAETICSELENS